MVAYVFWYNTERTRCIQHLVLKTLNPIRLEKIMSDCITKATDPKTRKLRKPNCYELLDDGSAIIWLRKRSGLQVACYVDIKDLESVLNYPRSWCATVDGYVRADKMLIHRFIMSPTDGLQVDHIDGDRLNNRRSNLRLVTHAQNQQNKKVASRSLPRNVHWCKEIKKWQVQMTVNYTKYNCGYFSDLEEAKRVAIEFRAKLFTHHNEDRIAEAERAGILIEIQALKELIAFKESQLIGN